MKCINYCFFEEDRQWFTVPYESNEFTQPFELLRRYKCKPVTTKRNGVKVALALKKSIMNFQQSPNARHGRSYYTTPKTPTDSNECKPRLCEEVAILMRASGDCQSSQSKESINLVEKIVIQQLQGIINEVVTVAFKRTGCPTPSQCDFEYLMRKSPAKLQRFRRYMKNVSKLKSVEAKQGCGNINFLYRLADDIASDEEEEAYDPEKMRRLLRADRISQVLNPQKYDDFQRARSWSSNIRNKAEMLRKLVEILQIPKDVQDNSNCLEIVLFLTIETVNTIVDYSILTRLNSNNHITIEPFLVSSSITSNMLHLCPEVTQGRGLDGIKPITVQEINEALRRVQEMGTKRMGTSFRSSDMKTTFLALWTCAIFILNVPMDCKSLKSLYRDQE